MPEQRPPERRPSLDAATAAIRHDVRRMLQQPVPSAPAGLARVLVGVSGGADSMALAAAVAHVAPRLGIEWGTLTVDHALQAGSAAVARRAQAEMPALGASFAHVRRVEVGAAGGPEAAARRARYAALEAERAATQSDLILLAHTMDDQAETVLLGLARGSGAASLQGMRPLAGRLGRPLLGLRREATRASCRAQGIGTWDDPQNHDASFARVRVRDRVLPVLERELGPGMVAALARTADLLAEDAAVLDAMAVERLEACEPGVLPAEVLRELPTALATRVVKRMLERVTGRAPARRHVLEVLRLATEWHGQGPLDVPGGRVQRAGGEVRVCRRAH
ncbi:tRNA lysidine(34) synthetase TilS [Pseudoclavibacter sp. 13-3]|uniref:tRNA lysidine(34) synthetase TilS n=1 Tax=Pseudoclavibacter sp. 13-3 TaxID=2901228 RepID=UPI001E5EE196|nr:tRNA lysidine(34) synthetase TilS [Pseudoclavibacter sp. 13-3]MCD7101480.1 tRNA lysidine(34) synthetase TilS [Pseudoclavibacter sp. 13-3]